MFCDYRFIQGTFQHLRPLLSITDEKYFQLRGRALECLGHIAVAIGKEQFVPYFTVGMESAQQGISTNDETLKEFSYVYFANCVKVIKNCKHHIHCFRYHL